MVKLKLVKNKKNNLNKKDQKSKSDIMPFLKQIKNNVDKIKSTKNKKYPLLSCLFLCFLEKKKKIIEKKEICEYIKKEINNNENKIFHININTQKVEPDLINQRNYNSKINQLLIKSKYFTKVINMGNNPEAEQIELNEEYINPRKNSIFKHLFGRKLYYKKISQKKRKRRKFENSVSIVKTVNKKTRKKENKNKDKMKDLDVKIKKNNNNQLSEIDYDNISSKENEINEKKEDLNNCNIIFDKIKLERKKLEPLNKNTFLNQKRKNPSISSKDNSLIMPLFADDYNNEKDYNNINNINDLCNENYEIEDGKISSSLKEINIIIGKGEEFILNLQGQKYINIFESNDNFRENKEFLSNYKDDHLILNFLNNAMEEYMKFNKIIEYFMYNKENNFDSEEEFNDIFNKELDILENFKIKRIKCSLLISKIITKLSQFLLEYNFIVETINKIYEIDKNCDALKNMLDLIDINKNILSKEYIKHFEKLLINEFDNAINFYMVNYGISE